MSNPDNNFDVEKYFYNTQIKEKHINDWNNKIAKLKSFVSKGVSHKDHKKVIALIDGYSAMIEIVDHLYVKKQG